MKPVKIPNIKGLKTYKCRLKPYYGVLIYPDEFETTDKDTNLIINFETKNTPSTGKFSGVSGVVVSKADDFKQCFIGDDYSIDIGDRILVNSNRTEIVYDGKLKLLLVREPYILAKLQTNLNISL